jgi:hypothetical protein
MSPGNFFRKFTFTLTVVFLVLDVPSLAADEHHSVARQWNEALLNAIRRDFARPTVHARNLYHVSAGMWDAWAAYDAGSGAVLHLEAASAADIEAAREEAVSYAAYRIMSWRFRNSPGTEESQAAFDNLMQALGFDINNTGTEGGSPAAVGNRIAQAVIDFGLSDGSNEAGDYANTAYEPVNPPLAPALHGNPDIEDPDRWQPLGLDIFIDQGGNPIFGGFPEFLSPEWGQVTPFSLGPESLDVYHRDGFDYWVYHDPGPPPLMGSEEYRSGFEQVVEWSGLLDPSDGVMIDIGPSARGNNMLGTNDGEGHVLNPFTGQPYDANLVPAGDYYRVLAEFWADGPDSETPPGHWFTLANYVSDHEQLIKQWGGEGPVLNDLEWDVRIYLTLGGAMHDVAISSWGIKGRYDYIRPVSAIRYMCDQGQSTDPGGLSYHENGISLKPGIIELVTEETTGSGGRHEHLAGGGGNIGKIAVRTWRGPDYVEDPASDVAGVGWILCGDWWPYQRPSFVTPPFAGYVSGHSTYSRAAADLLTLITGSEFFPAGLGEFQAPANEFLVFEGGPSQNITLQWATYADAADECSLSRIYGGIHPPADDIPGRLIGAEIAAEAFNQANAYFDGSMGTVPEQAFVINQAINDAWVSESAPFQGLFFNAFPEAGLLFLSWFTFDSVIPEGSLQAVFGAIDQRWVTGLGTIDGNRVTLKVELTSGGLFNSADPHATQQNNYGTITVEFIHCNEAVLTYSFPGSGLYGQMTLSRVLDDNVELCEMLATP